MSESVAVIDLGSNTARLALTHVFADRSFVRDRELPEQVRLADHLDAEGLLGPEGVARALAAARLFARFCEARGVDRVLAVATGAVRMARNGADVVRQIEAETGLSFEIISGEQEALYGYLGVANTLVVPHGLILDVGGASSEIVRVAGGRAEERVSLPFGALTVTRAFLDRDLSSPEQLERLDAHLAEAFRSLPWIAPGGRGEPGVRPSVAPPSLVGLGGTARAIGKIYRRQVGYPLPLIHGLAVPIGAVREIYRTLREKSLAERKEVPGLSRARADGIVGGTAVIHALAQAIGAETLTVSGRGVRDGVFFGYLLGTVSPDAVVEDPALPATRNLMCQFGVPETHTRHVAELAESLFDGLAPLHGLGGPERRLLGIAALLHDVGIAVSFYRHPAHGFYLIIGSGVDGLTHRELVIVAALVCAHEERAAPLERSPEYRSLLQPGDDRIMEQLAAILRLAEALDWSEAGRVTGVTCAITPDGSAARLEVAGVSDGDAEVREARGTLPGLEKAFGISASLAME